MRNKRAVPLSDLLLRPATPADLALLRRWDAEPHLGEALGGDDWQWETELHRDPVGRERLIAELDGRPFAFVEILDPARDDERYWGDVPPGVRAIDIWIGEPDLLGRGLGTRVMRRAIDRCFADPAVTAILLDPLAANTRAHRFYERLGFRFVETRTFGDDECFVYRLDRE